MKTAVKLCAPMLLVLFCAMPGHAQSSGSAPATDSAAPLSTPGMTGPLVLVPPNTFDAGPFGKFAVNGVLSGFGVWQNHPVPEDQGAIADLSNGQVFLQKADGVVQFYLQAGAYSLPSLGTGFISTSDTIHDFYGPLPVAYVKFAPKGHLSFEAGKLTSLLGPEYTFTFENIDIERGLLWNQENSVTRAVQVNYTRKKLTAFLSWGDGFYSNRWNWLSGLATYMFSAADSLAFDAGGNLGATSYSTTATPAAQNNSSIYNFTYTHAAKNWMIQPYFQFTHVSQHPQIGIYRTSATHGEAILGTYTLPHHISFGGRLEYTSSTGDAAQGAANLLYGPGSSAGSVTITPSYQEKDFFARAEVSYVGAGNTTAGDGFGRQSKDTSQVRGMVEAGFLF